MQYLLSSASVMGYANVGFVGCCLDKMMCHEFRSSLEDGTTNVHGDAGPVSDTQKGKSVVLFTT
jgi:hypothetical protein